MLYACEDTPLAKNMTTTVIRRKPQWSTALCAEFHEALSAYAGQPLTRNVLLDCQDIIAPEGSPRAFLRREWRDADILPLAIAGMMGFTSPPLLGKILGRTILEGGLITRLRSPRGTRKDATIPPARLPENDEDLAQAIAEADLVMDTQDEISLTIDSRMAEERATKEFLHIARAYFESSYKDGMTGRQTFDAMIRQCLPNTRPVFTLPEVPSAATASVKEVKVSLLGYPPSIVRQVAAHLTTKFPCAKFEFHAPWDKQKIDYRSIGKIAILAAFANFNIKQAAHVAASKNMQKIRTLHTASASTTIEILEREVELYLRKN